MDLIEANEANEAKWNPWALHETIKEIKEKFEKDMGGEYIEKPPVVCLCGSGRFIRSYEGAVQILTAHGIIFLTIGIVKGESAICKLSETEIDKAYLYRLHKSKIMMADAVIVICPGGYIGEATKGEIIFAQAQGKPIFYMRDSMDYHRGAITPY